MSTEAPMLAVLGLTRAEALDLRRALAGVGPATLEERPMDKSSAGVIDPVTLSVLGTYAAIQGLVAWLLKNRHETHIESEIEVRRPDGTIERRKFTLTQKDSTVDAATATVIEALELPPLDI